MFASSYESARRWPAELTLNYEKRGSKTRLVESRHKGPLRVLKSYYPDAGDYCEQYILHPPGGLVSGDSLSIDVTARQGAQVLLTTPSAGKVYGVRELSAPQYQRVNCAVDNDACLEWLPQETLVFSGANAELHSRFELSKQAKGCLWDIVCLGRPASNLPFTAGRCLQKLSVYIDQIPVLIERNEFIADTPLMTEPCGLSGHHTTGIFVATVALERDELSAMAHDLDELTDTETFAVTQKASLFIVRYLGSSVLECKQGFERVWAKVRHRLCKRTAVSPRVWLT